MIIEIQNTKIEVSDNHNDIKKGDLYLARRNTGWELLTCQKYDKHLGCIFADTLAYPYDIHECYKVVSML